MLSLNVVKELTFNLCALTYLPATSALGKAGLFGPSQHGGVSDFIINLSFSVSVKFSNYTFIILCIKAAHVYNT